MRKKTSNINNHFKRQTQNSPYHPLFTIYTESDSHYHHKIPPVIIADFFTAISTIQALKQPSTLAIRPPQAPRR